MPNVQKSGGIVYPKTVFIAGVIWIILGSSMLLISALIVAAEGAVGMSVFWPLVFGIASVYVGIQSVRGTARDTWGNGVGSIVFALLFSLTKGVGVIIRVADSRGREDPNSLVVGILLGAALIVITSGLLAAGILALMGRQKYKAWRRAHIT